MDALEYIKLLRRENLVNTTTTVVFKDKTGEDMIASVYTNIAAGFGAHIEVWDSELENVGRLMIDYDKDSGKFYLDTVYTYCTARRKGVAKAMFDIADYVLRDYDGCLLRGEFLPFVAYGDNSKDTPLDVEGTKVAYKKMGFEIITKESIDSGEDGEEVYKQIDIQQDFCHQDKKYDTIVAKVLHSKRYYPFAQQDGIIYMQTKQNKPKM